MPNKEDLAKKIQQETENIINGSHPFKKYLI